MLVVPFVAASPSQVLLVDDHPLLRSGLAVSLDGEPDLEVAAEVGSAHEAIEVLQRQRVDIVVLAVLLRDVNGISLATQLLEIQRDLRILALSTVDDPAVIGAMLRAGASGYAVKTQPVSEIMGAIRDVLQGRGYLPPHVSRTALLAHDRADRPLERLSRREREILHLLIHGYSNEEVGMRLFISRRTVETHRQRIMRKLGIHSFLDLVRYVAREGALVH